MSPDQRDGKPFSLKTAPTPNRLKTFDRTTEATERTRAFIERVREITDPIQLEIQAVAVTRYNAGDFRKHGLLGKQRISQFAASDTPLAPQFTLLFDETQAGNAMAIQARSLHIDAAVSSTTQTTMRDTKTTQGDIDIHLGQYPHLISSIELALTTTDEEYGIGNNILPWILRRQPKLAKQIAATFPDLTYSQRVSVILDLVNQIPKFKLTNLKVQDGIMLIPERKTLTKDFEYDPKFDLYRTGVTKETVGKISEKDNLAFTSEYYIAILQEIIGLIPAN